MRRLSRAAAMGTERQVRVGCPGAAHGPWSLGPPVRLRPYLLLRPRRWAEQAPGCPLRSAAAGSCHSSRSVSAATPSFVVGSPSPPLLRPRPVCICRTPASPDTGAGSRRARGGREGLRPRRRAWRGPTSREPAPPPRPLSAPAAAAPRPPAPGQAGASRAPRPTASLRGEAAPHSGPRT